MTRIFRIPVFILTIALIPFVSGKCYECNSVVEGDCGEKFNPKNILQVQCNGTGVSSVAIAVPGKVQHFTSVKNATGCLKVVVGDYIGNKHTIRTCYYGDLYDSAPDCGSLGPRFGFTNTMSCDICSADLCNGSVKVLPGVFVMLVFLFIGVFC